MNYFDLFKLAVSAGVGIYGANQQKKNNASNVGITSGISDNFKLPYSKFNREQVEERDDTNRRAGSRGRRYFTDANYTDEAGNVIDGLMSGNQSGIGGGNQITEEQAESQGLNAVDIAKGLAAGYIIPKLASAAYTGVKAGLASGSVTAGAKAALAKLGIGGANAAANVASNLVPNTGILKAGGDGFNYVYGGTLKNPAIQGMTQQQIAQQAAAKLATGGANVATGGLGTGGGTGMLGGLGALPTASQLAYLSPYFAAVPAMGMAAKYLLKPAIRGLTNFGSEEDAKREELAKYSKANPLLSNLDMSDPRGRRPKPSPFAVEMSNLEEGDRDYAEEQVVNRFQTPQGKAEMSKYYADNSEWYTPEGKFIPVTDLQRASADYNEQPIFGRDMRTGENPMAEYITTRLNKDDYGRIMGKRRFYNAGGIVGNNPNPNGYFLGGITDGMTDEIPANIDGEQEAALSDGEFVIPADVVSHFGNGNSNAGADKLQGMMQDVRKARTGNKNQGIQINPDEYLLRT